MTPTRKPRVLPDTLGTRLFTARRRCHYTQNTLAYLVEVDQKTISRWERDETDPQLHHFARLCVALGIGPWHLLAPRIRRAQHDSHLSYYLSILAKRGART